MDDLDYRHLLAQLTRMRDSSYGTTKMPEEISASVAGRGIRNAGPITAQDATTVLEGDLRRIAGRLKSQLPAFGTLDPVRQRVLLHIAFNVGVRLLSKMRMFISAVALSAQPSEIT